MAVCTYPTAVATIDQRYPLSCYKYTRLHIYFCCVLKGILLLTVFREPRVPLAPCALPVACSMQPGRQPGPAFFPGYPHIIVPWQSLQRWTDAVLVALQVAREMGPHQCGAAPCPASVHEGAARPCSWQNALKHMVRVSAQLYKIAKANIHSELGEWLLRWPLA